MSVSNGTLSGHAHARCPRAAPETHRSRSHRRLAAQGFTMSHRGIASGKGESKAQRVPWQHAQCAKRSGWLSTNTISTAPNVLARHRRTQRRPRTRPPASARVRRRPSASALVRRRPLATDANGRGRTPMDAERKCGFTCAACINLSWTPLGALEGVYRAVFVRERRRTDAVAPRPWVRPKPHNPAGSVD